VETKELRGIEIQRHRLGIVNYNSARSPRGQIEKLS
jgi:hypothetical protein